MSCEGCKGNDKPVDKMTEDAKSVTVSDVRNLKRVCVICATISFVFMMASIFVLGLLASGITITTDESTREEYHQSVEGDSAVINNGEFEQYNDNAMNGGGD